MNAEIFAEWLRRQGHKVYKTSGTYWFDAAPRVLQAFPYHWLIKPDDGELRNLMLQHGIVAVRYSTPVDYTPGKMSYHIVLNKCYDMHSVKHQARNGVKIGLENFQVEEVSFERLRTEGWTLQEDTLIRQHRRSSMTHKQWESLCTAAIDLPGFHAYGAISGHDLAGALIVCLIDDMVTVPYSMSHCRFLHYHVNNGLFFAASCHLLKQENINGIFFCVESLDAPHQVDEFKIRMGFEVRKVRQRVDFHPFLRPIAVPAVHSLTKTIHRHFPSVTSFAKLEGMLRFYLEGKVMENGQIRHNYITT
jgi:hypothetical protein